MLQFDAFIYSESRYFKTWRLFESNLLGLLRIKGPDWFAE
jgi:hypothetical protein